MTALPPTMDAWVAGHLGGDVEQVSVLTGGLSSQMHVVRSSAGQEAVLRRMTIQPWERFAEGLLNREYKRSWRGSAWTTASRRQRRLWRKATRCRPVPPYARSWTLPTRNRDGSAPKP